MQRGVEVGQQMERIRNIGHLNAQLCQMIGVRRVTAGDEDSDGSVGDGGRQSL